MDLRREASTSYREDLNVPGERPGRVTLLTQRLRAALPTLTTWC